MESLNHKKLNWKETFNQLMLKHIDIYGSNDVVTNLKDLLYEQLPVKQNEYTKDDQSLVNAIGQYFNKSFVNSYDLIAVAVLIRNGIERIIKQREK